MRVLFVTDERGLRGGERQLLLLGKTLEARGVEVALCARPGAALLPHFSRTFEAPMANALDLRGALAIARAAEAFGADVVHAFTSRAHALSMRTRRPLVVTRAVAFTAGRSFFGRRKYRGAARFIAVSGAAAEALSRAGAEPSRIDVVPPALELERLKGDRSAARKALGVEEDALAIGCTAALEREKGLGDLLEAMKRLKAPARLFIVGDGSLRAELEARAPASVRFLGRRDDVGALLTGFDAYVQPSLQEGFGLGAAEAMASGVPVVVTAAGGLQGLVEHGRTGLVVPPSSPESLAAALDETLTARDAALKRAQLARDTVLAKYRPEAMADATLAVYEKARAGA